MDRQRSLRSYRGIDLTLFAVMTAVFEYLACRAALRLFPAQPFTVSVTPVITAIVLMRWGPWAAVHAVLGGFIFCRMAGGGARQYLIWCAGNLFSLAALGLKKSLGAESIRLSTGKSLLFGLCTVLSMQLGRAAAALVLGLEPAAAVLFITTDVITVLFTLVVVWIARRLDGVFEDQRHYLRRLDEAERKEKGGYR